MYKIEYLNKNRQIVNETLKDQKQLVSFINMLDSIGLEIINIYSVSKGM